MESVKGDYKGRARKEDEVKKMKGRAKDQVVDARVSNITERNLECEASSPRSPR